MLRLIAAACLALNIFSARAEPIPLFDGSSADGWSEPDGSPAPWAIEDGALVVEPGSGAIRTRESFGSGRLHIEFLVSDLPPEATGQDRGNSGIYLMDLYEIQILDSAGTPPEANGCGAVYGLLAPAVNAALPAGAWQTYDIDFTAPAFDEDGNKSAPARVTVLHNGVTIHDHAAIDTPTGAARGRNETATGPIVLQDHGLKVRFRNITFDPRSAAADPPGPADEPKSVFKPIFDGKTLDGWEQRGGTAVYAVADGTIVGETRPGAVNTFLCTTARYADFELDLHFMIDPELNSGVQVRSDAKPEYKNGVVHGYQVEIDPSARSWTCGIYEENMRGWIDDLTDNKPAQSAFRPGEWNHMRVVAIGHHLRTFLNGVPAADIVDEPGALEGFIALQVHGVGGRTDPLQVRWKEIRVREIGP